MQRDRRIPPFEIVRESARLRKLHKNITKIFQSRIKFIDNICTGNILRENTRVFFATGCGKVLEEKKNQHSKNADTSARGTTGQINYACVSYFIGYFHPTSDGV